jgi:hypothetical protein
VKGRGLASRTLGNHSVDSVVSGKAANIDVFVAIYLGGWFLVTLAGHIASRWFGHTWSPPAHPLLGSALAGAVWPLLVIGLIEFSAIVVYANRGAKRDMGMAVLAECAHTGSRSTVSTIWEV